MDVDSPGPPPAPSTSTATGARKRSGEPNDAGSEDMIIYSSASEESSYDSDFVPVTRRKAKRRLLMASSSSKTLEPPVHTILFVPLTSTDCLNRLNRQATSVPLEALAPGQISDLRIDSRKNVLAIDVKQRSALDVLSNVKLMGNINRMIETPASSAACNPGTSSFHQQP
ncbi:hypothetical protein HPB50_002492 [Hyalomma asiaticum]|uniref:Uncharacterized protein n=1 Tax=Hyalomma asiaticum TaxID=266040 RepID=A0ACB7SQM1_HYAAI|nr:hypothetical protein HPB50_002492 [Hyalomma asiaticum]